MSEPNLIGEGNLTDRQMPDDDKYESVEQIEEHINEGLDSSNSSIEVMSSIQKNK